jgi:hypothetical protein
MFYLTLATLTCYIGCIKDDKKAHGKDDTETPGSKIVISGGSVKVYSPIGFASEASNQAVITSSRRKATRVHFPGSQPVPIPANTPWQLEVSTGLIVKRGAHDGIVIIEPKTQFGTPPADDPDGDEGVEDAVPTDPTSISLTINNGTPQSYPFTKPDKIFIDFKK